MQIFITGPSNKPSGGVKVMNQVAVLFEEHGFESFVVCADNSQKATFLDQPAKTINIEEYSSQLKKEDITIDFWADKRLVNIASQKRNQTRVFWQHGASVPKGGLTIGDSVFCQGNPYTQHWNVSKACGDYFQKNHNLKMSIVHPFFDSPTMKEFQERAELDRDGILILARRGQKYIPLIQKHFSSRERITILTQPFHERDFFEELLCHKYFISTDDGIEKPKLKHQIKKGIKYMISSDFREILKNKNDWIVPKGHLLGFPMPPVEAAWLGCVVIGFAMGGGLEWMNEDNCFLAKDRNQNSLLSQIDKAINAPENELNKIRPQAIMDTKRFNKKNTWEQLTNLLDLKISSSSNNTDKTCPVDKYELISLSLRAYECSKTQMSSFQDIIKTAAVATARGR